MKKTQIIYIGLLLILGCFVLSGCSISTARFDNLVTSATVDEDYYPLDETETFITTTPIIYLTGKIKNATIDSTIRVEWYYVEGESEIFIGDSILNVSDINMDFYFSLSKPTNNWPTGKYEIRLYYDDKHQETVSFKVE